MQFRLPPMPMSVHEQAEALLMVVGAAILGGLIGTEREWRSKPAGIRTQILVAVSAALVVIWDRHSLSFIQLALRDLLALYREYTDVPLVSISDAQREPMPWANWCATVYHGLPDDLYQFYPEPGGYLAFLGRICPEKRVDRAIAIAQRAGIELKIAAKVDAVDEEYFETKIRHLLNEPLVEFIGEIGDGEKEAFLGGAAALLMPIGWPEPFGLVVIEAMACGTPVIAFPFGSMPELIEPWVNGALVESVDQAVAAVEALAALDRSLCRRSFEQRFTTARMARNYVSVYERLVEEAASAPGAARPAAGIPIAVPALVAAEAPQPAAWLDRTGFDGSEPR
jgi:glycosyltransferase involved in cell wall biosynthesis